jgi:plasmid stability protein
MATLTIRNLPAALVVALKRLAAHHDRSMEQEVRTLLHEKVLDRVAALDEIEAARQRDPGTSTPNDILRWLGRKEG